MHIEIAQCADFVWRGVATIDITGFKPVFLCARHALRKNRLLLFSEQESFFQRKLISCLVA